MITIGDKELLQSYVLFLKDDEEAVVEFELPEIRQLSPPMLGNLMPQQAYIPPLGPIKLRCILVFKSGPSPGKWTATATPQGLRIECVAWEHQSGPSAMDAPGIAMQNYNGKTVGFFVAHVMYGPKLHQATIQFYLGGNYAR